MTETDTLKNLCIHTITTKPWTLDECIEHFGRAGIGGITVWRNVLAGQNIRNFNKRILDHNLKIVALCRGGFFPSIHYSERNAAIDDNKLAIDQAYELGAPLIVMVCGADPRQSLAQSRDQIRTGIEAILPHAQAAGIKLAIEPLHPMYAGDRSAINTMKQANDMAIEINSDYVGVAIDVYHVWWDDTLQSEIKRCGLNKKLFAYHICDWKLNTSDLLNDRGLMGEGCIPIGQITQWVKEAGFIGMQEVEIFSNLYWSMDQSVFLDKIITAYKLIQ